MAHQAPDVRPNGLTGRTITGELLRNMELGQFEMAYSILLPCVFSAYLHPEDYARLQSVFPLLADDAKRALCQRVAKLNHRGLGRLRRGKEYRIAGKDWTILFFADSEGTVPPGDVEIHSELNDAAQPGYQGAKTTLLDREPSVTSPRPAAPRPETHKLAPSVFAEIRYEDDSGAQIYLVTQSEVRIGRGGGTETMDLALYANDEVSREHLLLRRDPATGQFYVTDRSTNGTWVDGRRLKRGAEQPLAERAEIGIAEVITLGFQVRK